MQSHFNRTSFGQYSAVSVCACAEPAEANVREVTAVPMISMNGESVFLKNSPKYDRVWIMCVEDKYNNAGSSEGENDACFDD